MDRRVSSAIGAIVVVIGAVLLLRRTAVAQIMLEDLAVNPISVNPGQEVTISVTAVNRSNQTLTGVITLGGDFMADQTITLEPGESITVTFYVTADIPKTYIAKVDGLTGSFVCTEEPVADIRLSDLVITPAKCNIGDTVTISATATNHGSAPGSKTIICTVT